MSIEDGRRELAATATQLNESVKQLQRSIDGIGGRTQRAERFIVLIGVSLVLELVLLVVVVALLVNQHSTSARVDNVCALYAFVVGSYAPQTRAPGDDREAYIQAFAGLRAGYEALGCTEPIVPPRVNATPPTR